MAKLITFDEAIEASDGEERALLIGNGFSIKHFSYKTLLEKSGLDAKAAVAITGADAGCRQPISATCLPPRYRCRCWLATRVSHLDRALSHL